MKKNLLVLSEKVHFKCSSFPHVVSGNPVPYRFLACALSLLLALSPLTTALAADTKRQITLTTYYPAPFGSYERVQTGKGVTPAAPGDIAIQRQMKVGRAQNSAGFSPVNFGQAVINIDVNNLPFGYLYQGTTVFYNISGANNFWNNENLPEEVDLGGGTTGLSLDIAVGGNSRISGQGKAAIAGYIDVLPWNDGVNEGGEITLRGTGGTPVNWSMDVSNNQWRVRSDIDSPFDTGALAYDILIASNTGNLFVGQMNGTTVTGGSVTTA